MRLLTLALLLSLSACSTKPTTTYYQLPVPSVTAQPGTASLKAFYIEPIQVASYLNGRGLVLQVSDVELVVAKQHIWADALDQQLQRQLRNRLQLLAPGYIAVFQPLPDTLRVSVQLEQFYGDSNGQALISGRFAVSNQLGTVPFVIRQPLADDGYPALVAALAQGVQQLSQQIAQHLLSGS